MEYKWLYPLILKVVIYSYFIDQEVMITSHIFKTYGFHYVYKTIGTGEFNTFTIKIMLGFLVPYFMFLF